MNYNTDQIAEGFKGEKAIVTPYNIREYQSKNKITRQLYITHIGYYPNAKKHFRDRPEGSNENILIYCVNGNGWIEHNGTKHILKKDQVYIIPKGSPHAYGANNRNPWSIYWFHFNGEESDVFTSLTNNIINIAVTDSSREQDRAKLFEEMYQNLEMGYQPENLEYTSFSLRYFLASIKYLNQFREINKVKVDDTTRKCILFMKDNIENKISLDEIAEHVRYSKSHLTALFREKTSFSPMEYYNQLRIQRACTYLQFSELKIKEIAFKLNFYDPFHFSKAFLLQMEISPSEYRKRYKE